MPYEDAYKQWLQKLDALPEDAIRKPKMPIKELCSEAEQLAVTCRNDKSLLIKTGLDWQDVKDLKTLSNALRYCESLWQATPKKSAELKQWLEVKKQAMALKKELLRHYHYAFFHHPAIKKKVSSIGLNRSNKYLSQDLALLAQYGLKHAAILAKINFDAQQIEMAQQLSKQVSETLADNRVYITPKDSIKRRRDSAYTLLYQKLDNIRRCGKYLFKDDEKKYIKYKSNYYLKRNNRNREV